MIALKTLLKEANQKNAQLEESNREKDLDLDALTNQWNEEDGRTRAQRHELEILRADNNAKEKQIYDLEQQFQRHRSFLEAVRRCIDEGRHVDLIQLLAIEIGYEEEEAELVNGQ